MEELRILYNDPKRGFLSSTKLYKKAKDEGINITYKQIKEFLSKQEGV